MTAKVAVLMDLYAALYAFVSKNNSLFYKQSNLHSPVC